MKGKIALIGATGNVGRGIVEILKKSSWFSTEDLLLFASKQGMLESYAVESADTVDFEGCFALVLATESEVSERYVPRALEEGCYVIDTSSLYRLNDAARLIVPPVNHQMIDREHYLYASSNCVVSPLATALKPLHDKYRLKRVTLTTYQSVSGAGKKGIDALHAEVRGPFPREIAFNVIPQIGGIGADGSSSEEEKIVLELQKVLKSPIAVIATAVRVSVKVGHSIALTAEFEKDFELEEARSLLESAPGVVLSEFIYTTPKEVEGLDHVFVGRLRKERMIPNALSMWLVSDNLRRGAALDAIEILEKLVRQK